MFIYFPIEVIECLQKELDNGRISANSGDIRWHSPQSLGVSPPSEYCISRHVNVYFVSIHYLNILLPGMQMVQYPASDNLG